ncbi:spermidine synthase [Hymenobacter metallilatus]|uniref:Methyltransferase domain-containing protein n=1 Tax=Hymenobacter metallilatus TaxID=2493666 RepID=A0A428JSJ1_9BACT|nr:fused MFS/spermidine synthase [Hymenobacter metallilatus]RSK37117.1 methyltransferase domain-containing protein [Hymenobacter metallilatus]
MMNKLLTSLHNWISYALPLARRVPSRYSPGLVVRQYQGRKVLDTRFANYSYGPLQQVLRYALLHVGAGSPAAPVLVLGMGGGGIIQLLRQERGHTGPITAVELDPAVVEVAATEFNIRPDATLDIVCADAFAWLPTAPTAAYELVVVDVFLDLLLPPALSEPGCWQHLRRVLRPGGTVVLNTLLQVPLYIGGQPAPEYLPGLGLQVKELEVEYNLVLIARG